MDQRTESGMNPCYSFGLHGAEHLSARSGVVPNSAPLPDCAPLVLVGLGVGVGEGLGLGVGLGLGLGNQAATSRGCGAERRAALDHTTPLYTALGDTVKKVVEFAAESLTSQ